MFEVDKIKKKIKNLEKKVSLNSWKETDKNIEILQELHRLKEKEEEWNKINVLYEELLTLEQLLEEEKDESLEEEKRKKLVFLQKKLKEYQIKSLLNGKNDRANAILSVHPGAGGTDSCDWAEILLRMYLEWAGKRGYRIRVVERIDGEEAGIKTAVVVIEGEFAYGYLKQEVGIHRLVRISPFDASHRRHTSFAAVDVIPEVDEIKVEIKESDLHIDTFRSSGPGGQHVNVTDSAVRITHLPTGIIVQCQNERSQHKNKATAMRILKARLYNFHELEKEKGFKKRHKEKARIEWGNQVRSYILHPYTLVKDHRTNVERSDVERVLEGDIDGFIIASLKEKNLINRI
ncbi:peptide chain release factor 2 [Candidatus Aerophobetes bacterium]|nr:peptide chain release factor 2 [Candidatus Aerophobetes bacterium]